MRAAYQVGNVLKYVSERSQIAPRYATCSRGSANSGLYGESGKFISALHCLKLSYVVAIRMNHGVWMFSGQRLRRTRWLMIHGRIDEAEAIVREIERQVQEDTGLQRLPDPGLPIAIRPRGPIGIVEVATTMIKRYPQRSLLGFALMVGQAFLYNAVFFTYALVLTKFYHVPSGNVGLYLSRSPSATSSVHGPWGACSTPSVGGP